MKKNKNLQFPSIYRVITESRLLKDVKNITIRLNWQSKHGKYALYILTIISVFIAFLLVLGIFLTSISFYQKASDYRKISQERKSIQEKINFWQSIINKYEGYKDAYFQIALLEFKRGNIKKALEYNKKALLLDPNFEDSKKLQLLLEE
jgi:tetratricopeptide (TPR) repeat protein